MERKYIIALICCAVFFILITINPLFNVLPFEVLPILGILDKDLATSYGTIIGGIFGPILTLISFFIIYNSFQEQKKQIFLSILNDDIKYLRDYVSSIRFVDPESVSPIKVEIGELFFIKAKRQLDILFKIIDSLKIFDEENCIGATAEVFYTGVSKETIETLKHHLKRRTNDDNVKKIIDEIRKQRTKYNNRIFYYGGHQGKLGHYFRQLGYIFGKIDNCPLNIDKYEVAESVRVKMSNYEQAILCYNSFTHLGKSFRKKGKKGYIEKYKLICNIPQNLLPFDLKKYFDIEFEYEK